MSDSLIQRATVATLETTGSKRIVTDDAVMPNRSTLGAMDPLAEPSGEGWTLRQGVQSTLKIRYHQEYGARSIWLKVSGAATTGNCVLALDFGSGAVTSTFVAAGEEGEDFVLAWADEIATDFSGDVEVTTLRHFGTGEIDTIRITAVRASAGFNSFEITQISAPASAQLALYREYQECTGGNVFTRSSPIQAGGASRPTAITTAQSIAWGFRQALPTHDWRGLTLHNLDLAGEAAIWVQLTGAAAIDTLPSLVTSGPGLYAAYPAILVEIAQGTA